MTASGVVAGSGARPTGSRLAIRQSLAAPRLKSANATVAAINTRTNSRGRRASTGCPRTDTRPSAFPIPSFPPVPLLSQPFGLHRFLDGRTLGHATHVRLDVRPVREVDLEYVSP